MSWKSVHDFELLISDWFGAKYGVAVDSCTHGIELCLHGSVIGELKFRCLWPCCHCLLQDLTALAS